MLNIVVYALRHTKCVSQLTFSVFFQKNGVFFHLVCSGQKERGNSKEERAEDGGKMGKRKEQRAEDSKQETEVKGERVKRIGERVNRI